MLKDLELLVMLHDIDLMIKEISDEKIASEVKSLGFTINRVDQLKEARENLCREIESSLYRHYDRIFKKYGRAIVPVVGGACTGCFVQLPISQFSVLKKNEKVISCENCGRFLYYVM